MHSIRKVGGTYYARYIIPKARWADFNGRRDKQRTLETRDPKEARKRRDAALAAIRAELNADLAARGLRPLDSDWTPNWQVEALQDRARLERADDSDWHEDPNDGTYFPSSRDVMADRIEERARELEDLKGPAVASAYFKVATAQVVFVGPLAERWLASAEGGVAKQTIKHRKFALNMLATFQGRGKPATSDPEKVMQTMGIEDISRDRAASFLEWLELDLNKHPTTCARIQSSLSSFWKWAVDRRQAKENVWVGLAAEYKRKARRKATKEGTGKEPYTDDEIVLLLRADPNAGRRWSYGTAIFDLLRLGLLTGARLNELCSLRRMDIIESGTGMKVDAAVAKTDNAVRKIPLHALAQKIVEQRLRELPATDDPAAPIFPELPPGGPDKKRSWKVSSHYSKWRKEVLAQAEPLTFTACAGTSPPILSGHEWPVLEPVPTISKRT